MKPRNIPVAASPSEAADSSAEASAGGFSNADWLSVVEEKVRNLRFGVVQITIHDGKVMHIDRTERTKLDISPGAGRADKRGASKEPKDG